MRILIIASWYKVDNSKTDGSFIEEQARMLQKAGHNVTVIHPYLKGTFLRSLRNRKSFSSVVIDNGIQTIRVGVSPFFPRMRNLSYKKLVRYTIKLLKDQGISGEFDLIHSHSLFMGGIVGYHLSKSWNIPLYHTEHTSGLIFKPSDYNYQDRLLLKKVFDHAKFVFCVSRFFQKELISRYSLPENNIRVLPNVVNPIFFNPSDFPTGNFKVLVIGNFIEIKQHHLIIDAWKIVHENFDDAVLTLIGDGPLQSNLEEKVSELGLTNTIIFVGRQSRENIKAYISQSHLIVSCSKIETFGLAIAEAIAMGRPVVATNSGGVSDIINPGNGIILDKNTAAEMAIKIKDVLMNLNSFTPQLISENLEKKFGEEIICRNLINMYSSN